MTEIHEPNPQQRSPQDLLVEMFGEPIHVYTREQAIEDGNLVPLGPAYVGDLKIAVCITKGLFAEYGDLEACRSMLLQGFALLRTPDPQDTPYMKLRVIEPDKAWVILDGDGITFLRPEDY